MTEETTSKAELFKALNQFHKNLQQPSKDGTNPFFKSGYVTLEGVQDAVDKAIEGTGLSYFQMVFDDQSGNKAVKTVIAHESGATITMGALSLSPAKSDPQGYGSAITYAKRYQLAAAFGISSEKDDDANQATFNKQTSNPKKSSYNAKAFAKAKQEYISLASELADRQGVKLLEIEEWAKDQLGLQGNFTNANQYEGASSKIKQALHKLNVTNQQDMFEEAN